MNAPSTRQRWKSLAAFGLKAFLNFALVAVLIVGARRLAANALAAPAHRVDLGAWTVHARPDWVSLHDVEVVRDDAGLIGSDVSLLDREGLAFVRKRLAASPRVRRVVALRRKLPNRLVVDVELREPVAAVAVEPPAAALRSTLEAVHEPGDSETAPHSAEAYTFGTDFELPTVFYVEVDIEGIALSPPQADHPMREGRRLRVIAGATSAVPDPGLRFGSDVSAAAALCARLDAPELRSWTGPLACVDVSNHGGRVDARSAEVVLRREPLPSLKALSAGPDEASTATAASAATSPPACRVEWGRVGAAAEEMGEPGFEEKLARLRKALQMFPGLRNLASVNVAFSELLVVPRSGSELQDGDRTDRRRGVPGETDRRGDTGRRHR